MNEVARDILMHYGIKRRSGRYPWGSGDSPYQHELDFLSRYNSYKKQGLSEKEIADKMECVDGTAELRRYIRIANHEREAQLVSKAQKLRDEGKTYQEISDELGLSGPPAARAMVINKENSKRVVVDSVVDRLREEVQKKGAIDIGEGVETDLGVSRDTLLEAATRLGIEEGYNIHGVGIQQPLGGRHQTNTMVLTKDISQGELYKDPTLIKSVADIHSDDGGLTWRTMQYPASIDSSRIAINYGDQGGSAKDGVIEIRPGVADLSLGDSHYAQVRILVDGTHYLKGMAMYSDDIPDGADIKFNTNKKSGMPMESVLKEIKDDPDNPFGAYIKANGQSEYIGADGKKHLSAINKLREEGEWNEQNVALSAQFLGKQSEKLAKRQLDITYNELADEYDKIKKINNNVVKQQMLDEFADKCDKASADIKAAGLPRQKTQVILPLTDIKDNEVYAPQFKNGEQVALVRYPHAGTFEIPVLTVNNKNAQGKSLLGQALDAVGINTTVAEKLSGADFDGDTVSVLPLGNHTKIKTSTLKGMTDANGKAFDPKSAYPPVKDEKGNIVSRVMSKTAKGIEMGKVSNLITDMTLKGANDEEIARAVKHSMVVIDAEKHKLNYRQSEVDNGIDELKKKYQVHTEIDGSEKIGGPSTLLSRAGAETRIAERRAGYKINPATGEKEYTESGRTYYQYKKDKNGNTVKTGPFKAEQEVPQISLVSDANQLSTGTKMESVYATHINKVKALANNARKEKLATPNEPHYNKNAAETYQKEVASLNSKLKGIELNKPKERQALIRTNAKKAAMLKANPDLKSKENKAKLNNMTTAALFDSRAEVGAKSQKIHLTDREWDAIQSGAISFTKAQSILKKVDKDELKQRATPKQTRELTATQQARIRSLRASGYNQAEIAESLGVSPSTVSKYLGGKS